ncbi:MAG: 3-isopropylmalate dehydratase large subunit [Candidatus Helarchaeota archaeon]
MSTIAEKILAEHSNKLKVNPGEIINASVDVIMSHEMLSMRVIKILEEMDVRDIIYPDKLVVLLDHWIPPANIDTAIIDKREREFVKKHKIKNWFDWNNGICHQVIPEKGFAWPGALIVGTDSHTCTYGAFGAFATGIGSTDAAILLATGELWFKVPESIKFELTGNLQPMVYGKDVILKLISEIGVDGATYKSVEFTGNIISNLSIDSRMTICNMAIEMGAKTGIIIPDKKTLDWLNGRVKIPFKIVQSDNNAIYDKIYEYDLTELEPQVAKPHSPENSVAVGEVSGVKIDQAFIGSCTNGRYEDLEIAAKILKNQKIHPDTRLIIVPASKEVYLKALEKGFIKLFIESGAFVNFPSCGPCIGAYGVLAPGETSLSTSNRNFIGRQGSKKAKIYLSNAAVVAASSIKGEIVDPRSF